MSGNLRITSIAVALGFVVAAASPALAQETKIEAPKPETPNSAAPQANSRFSMRPVDGGFLRLDGVTGQVSFCSQREPGWTCQAVPEDRAALDAEIARLQNQVASLKAEVAKAVPPRPPGDLSPQGKEEPIVRMPTREEMERAKVTLGAAVERAWRSLVDTINEFQKDMMKKG